MPTHHPFIRPTHGLAVICFLWYESYGESKTTDEKNKVTALSPQRPAAQLKETVLEEEPSRLSPN